MSCQWPLDSHVLIVDDDKAFCDAIVLQMSSVGCECHVAGSYEKAREVFRNNPKIGVILVDHTSADVRVDALADMLRAYPRDDVVVVGNSGSDRREDFAAAGVNRFLRKPWRIDQLVKLIVGRITSCGECGSRLPLRHPRDGEEGRSWMCTFCGSRFRALIDEDAPRDIRLNVRIPE